MAMKGATDYKDKGDLKEPRNQVLAILPAGVDLSPVVMALHEAGFAEDAIGLLSGRHDVRKLEAASGKKGILAKLARIGPEFGDIDADTLRKYETALEKNKSVIAVVAKSGEKRREVAELLKRYGATFINSFGVFSIEGLG
jgi:rhodanese-related sulfurtransferase